jgi:hypothetical protein
VTHDRATLLQRSPNTMVTYEETGNATRRSSREMSADVIVLLPISICRG